MLFTNAPSRVCFLFCFDAKRNKKSRLRLHPDPISHRKLRQIKMIIADIYFSFNAFFVQRVPRASAEVENLTDEGSQTLLWTGASKGVRQPRCIQG